MARQTLTKRGGGGSNAPKIFATAGVLLMALFFISLGGDNNLANEDNLRSGQAARTEGGDHDYIESNDSGAGDYAYGGDGDKVATGGGGDDNGGGGGYDNNYGDDEESYSTDFDSADLDEAVTEALEDIREAEDNELNATETSLTGAISNVGNYVRIGMGRLFGPNEGVNSAEMEEVMEEVAEEIEEELQNDVNEELEKYAEDFYSHEEQSMKDLADREEADGVDLEEIEYDVWKEEEKIKGDFKSRIEQKKEDIESHLRSRASKIELDILQKRLSERLHHKVELKLVDDEVVRVDDLLDGLNHIDRGGSQMQGYPPQGAMGYGGNYNNNNYVYPPQQRQPPPNVNYGYQQAQNGYYGGGNQGYNGYNNGDVGYAPQQEQQHQYQTVAGVGHTGSTTSSANSEYGSSYSTTSTHGAGTGSSSAYDSGTGAASTPSELDEELKYSDSNEDVATFDDDSDDDLDDFDSDDEDGDSMGDV